MSDPRIRAPELTDVLDWFNVPAPLSLKALRGKIVLLDFWTYGCVNCMHILPDLKRLEEKYARELVVIGVHSAKFANERKSDNIRRIIVRYDITHPVANDANFAVWKAYGARAWPTQVLIDPEGYVVATVSGEGKAEAFDRAIAAVVQVFDERGSIDRSPLPTALEGRGAAGVPDESILAFPGKVLADEARGRLFIADSNHHRVLVANLDGEIEDVAGTGTFGLVNGGFDDARFYRPQGLAIDPAHPDRVYVADTENHAVRALDLAPVDFRRRLVPLLEPFLAALVLLLLGLLVEPVLGRGGAGVARPRVELGRVLLAGAGREGEERSEGEELDRDQAHRAVRRGRGGSARF